MLAYAIGAGRSVDDYSISFAIVTVATTIAVGPIVVALLPTYISVLTRDGRHAANRLLGDLVPLVGLAVMGLTVIIEAAAPGIIRLVANGNFSQAHLMIATDLLRISLLLIPIRAANQIVSALLNSEHMFALPVTSSAIPSLVAIASLIALSGSIGVFSLVDGLVLGESLQLAVLLVLAAPRIGAIPLRRSQFGPELLTILGQYYPSLAGTSIAAFNPLINRTIASGLRAGSIAHLLYAERITSGIVQIAGVAFSAVLLPHFSRMVAAQEYAALRRSMKVYAVMIFAVCAVPLLIFELFARDFAGFLLQRGSFHAADTIAVGGVLQFMILQVPFEIAGTMSARIVAALRVTPILTVGAILNVILNFVLAVFFSRHWQLQGIAAATFVVMAWSWTYLFISSRLVIRRRERAMPLPASLAGR